MNKIENKSIVNVFVSSPLAVVLTVAIIVVFVISFAGYVRRGGFWTPEVEARVFNEGRDRNQSSGMGEIRRRFAFQGEVYNQAEQIRESAALALGTTLLATQRTLEHKPLQTVDESLIAGVARNGLLPPGLTLDSSSSVVSSYGNYYIRYREQPLGVEVLSISKGASAGVAIIVRVPDDGFSENALTYYIISKAGLQMPGGFAPVAELFRSGWRPETFKAAELAQAQKEQERQWLAARAAGGK